MCRGGAGLSHLFQKNKEQRKKIKEKSSRGGAELAKDTEFLFEGFSFLLEIKG